jgi:hypothetical protein
MPSINPKSPVRVRPARYNFPMSQGTWPGKTILNVRKRSAAFKTYKCLTGVWPVLTAALYAGRFLLMFILISALFWYGRQHSSNVNRVTLYALVGFLPVIFVWNILETLAWNYDLRRKGLIPRGTYLGLTQIPAG